MIKACKEKMVPYNGNVLCKPHLHHLSSLHIRNQLSNLNPYEKWLEMQVLLLMQQLLLLMLLLMS